MTTPPMLADFAVRLAGGLAGMLLLTPRSQVPPAFFRTHCLVMLGLLVGAALSASRSVPSAAMAALITAAVMAYLASAAWGLGLPRVGRPLTACILLATVGLMLWAASDPPTIRPALRAFNAGARLASAALMGATLTAMLLGHHYLTAPAMSIAPLRRFVAAMAVTLALRAGLAGLGMGFWLDGMSGSGAAVGPLFLGMRWGMGVLGPALAVVLTWKTVQIRATQSATGILYIAMTLVLFGELSGLILGRGSGIEF